MFVLAYVLFQVLCLRVRAGTVFTTFFFVTYEWAQKSRLFVHGKPFQPSLMFVGKGRSLPRVKQFKDALLGLALQSLESIKREENLVGKNTLAYFVAASATR